MHIVRNLNQLRKSPSMQEKVKLLQSNLIKLKASLHSIREQAQGKLELIRSNRNQPPTP